MELILGTVAGVLTLVVAALGLRVFIAAKVVKELGEALIVTATALADNELTGDEIEQIFNEFEDVYVAVMGMIR